MKLFEPDRPSVYTIPNGVAFADVLAATLQRHSGGGPAALADYLILVPNRRAVGTIEDAFLRAADGRARILPDIQPIGDISEEDLVFEPAFSGPGLELELGLAPPIPRFRRLLLLTRQIRQAAAGLGQAEMPSAGALQLAGELARLLDEMQTEEISLGALRDLAPERFAHHWQEVLKFLDIVTTHWPAVLEADGHSDIAIHRNRITAALAEAWQAHPPSHYVIAAGSTGSRTPTAALLSVVARLERGAVVLPALDKESPDEVWEAINAPHPQFTMKRLLERIEVARDAVKPWPLPPRERRRLKAKSSRIALAREALRPAPTISGWPRLRPDPKLKFHRLSALECANQREEAGTIALLLREALEEPERTAALVTADRRLARQVAAELERWGILIDDSAGRPLALTTAGSFFLLLARAVAENYSPVPLLSLLKHPYTAAGLARAEFLSAVRRIEKEALRGPRPGGGMRGLRRALGSKARRKGYREFLRALEAALAPLEKLRRGRKPTLETLLAAHIEAALALAATDDAEGGARLWSGDDGRALADFLDDLSAAAGIYGDLPLDDYAAAVERLMQWQTVRPHYGRHPRLQIWGPLEARLQSVDRMIVGGLNEGSWPPAPDDDPWMSRPMREEIGLPLPERRVGQSAHDFLEAIGADEVILTRAAKVDGTPSVPSRWLLRLEALAGPLPRGGLAWSDWYHALDRPSETAAAQPPQPRPPPEARPRRLSVTGIETLMCDPYAIYASRILGLKPLDAIDEPPGVKARGIIIHRALDRFLSGYEGDWDGAALEALIAAGREAFEEARSRPGIAAYWWPRFLAAAEAFIDEQRRRAAAFEVAATEIRGRMRPGEMAADFTLTATADRIDRRAGDGGLVVIDYKTGTVPSDKQIAAGFAPQLPLEALMAHEGAFEELPAGPVEGFEYWQVTGGEPALRIKRPGLDPGREMGRAEAGLRRLIEHFADPEAPYLSNPRPLHAGYGDYDHLARVKEWRFGVPDEGDGP